MVKSLIKTRKLANIFNIFNNSKDVIMTSFIWKHALSWIRQF